MEALKVPFRIGAMMMAVALIVPACVASEPDDSTSEERDPSSDDDEDDDDAPRGRDTGKTSDAGSARADAGRGRDAGRDARGATKDPEPGAMGQQDDDDEGDDDASDDEPADEPGDDDSQGDDEPEDPGTDAPGDAEAPAQGGQGEVITTEDGTKIYVDPSCPSMTPMLGSRMIELVGCCMEGMNKCGLSTHKLMIPAQFAAMFPTACRGYEALSMLMVEAPEEKACTISE